MLSMCRAWLPDQPDHVVHVQSVTTWPTWCSATLTWTRTTSCPVMSWSHARSRSSLVNSVMPVSWWIWSGLMTFSTLMAVCLWMSLNRLSVSDEVSCSNVRFVYFSVSDFLSPSLVLSQHLCLCSSLPPLSLSPIHPFRLLSPLSLFLFLSLSPQVTSLKFSEKKLLFYIQLNICLSHCLTFPTLMFAAGICCCRSFMSWYVMRLPYVRSFKLLICGFWVSLYLATFTLFICMYLCLSN